MAMKFGLGVELCVWWNGLHGVSPLPYGLSLEFRGYLNLLNLQIYEFMK
jgi:hypothetical protein